MALFSERYKYITPNEALIREAFPDTVANGICSCYDELKEQLERSDRIYAMFMMLWKNIFGYFS